MQNVIVRRFALAGLTAVFLATTGVVYAQKTPKHPNLVAAQLDLGKAWDKLLAAQKANEFDLGGHAAKAKDLIDQAQKEVKLAVDAAGK